MRKLSVLCIYGDVWKLLYDAVDPQKRAKIDEWITDFIDRNPYNGGPIDKYFNKAAGYFKAIFPDRRKIGSITMGLNEIAKSLHPDDFIDKPEKDPDSVGDKIDNIIDRLEVTLDRKDKKK